RPACARQSDPAETCGTPAPPTTVAAMLRRAILSLVPALLALAFLCGTPAACVDGPEVGATSLSTASATAPVVRGTITQDVADIAVDQSADDDDHPDSRVIRITATVVWPASTFAIRILHASVHAGDRHQPSAARPRAPPIA